VKGLFVAAGLDARVAADDLDMDDTVHAKLLVNCVVNPLTALCQVRNGVLLTNKYRPIVEALAAETSCILKMAAGFQL
jgi:ketopantoate reductase